VVGAPPKSPVESMDNPGAMVPLETVQAV
jgi:hypothetical protein